MPGDPLRSAPHAARPDHPPDHGALAAPRDRPAQRAAARVPHPALRRRGGGRARRLDPRGQGEGGSLRGLLQPLGGAALRDLHRRAPRPRRDLRRRGARRRDPDRAHARVPRPLPRARRSPVADRRDRPGGPQDRGVGDPGRGRRGHRGRDRDQPHHHGRGDRAPHRRAAARRRDGHPPRQRPSRRRRPRARRRGHARTRFVGAAFAGRLMSDDPGYFPRGRSVLRRVQGERAVGLLYGQRALMLGALHPLNFVGTMEHPYAREMPFQRLAHTGKAFEAIFFGTRAEADEVLARVRRLHDGVRGEIPEDAGTFAAGTPYSAMDPELMLWTVAVMMDSAEAFYDLLVRRLDDGERESLWQDYLRFAALFEMPLESAPATYR